MWVSSTLTELAMFFIIKPIIEGLFDKLEGPAFRIDESTYKHLMWISRGDRVIPQHLLPTFIQDKLLDMWAEHEEFVGQPMILKFYHFRRWHGRLELYDRMRVSIK